MAKSEAENTARELLERLGLGDRADAYPDQLSGGQQQRVAIARSLAMSPEILLLDEITSALDPELVGEVLDVVRELKGSGITLLIATHEMAFAREISDRVCFLHAGSVAEILANLLENAFRYSPAGSPVGLHCHAATDGGWQLTLWDGGPAIEASEREAIFARGVRGSSGAAVPGTGLGLALARDLARHLGGELELICPPAAIDPALPSTGNAFRLTLPPGPRIP